MAVREVVAKVFCVIGISSAVVILLAAVIGTMAMIHVINALDDFDKQQ